MTKRPIGLARAYWFSMSQTLRRLAMAALAAGDRKDWSMAVRCIVLAAREPGVSQRRSR